MCLTVFSISALAVRLNKAILAPAPAEFPAAITLSNAQSGTIPNIIAYLGSI